MSFCASARAYHSRPQVRYPRSLGGARSRGFFLSGFARPECERDQADSRHKRRHEDRTEPLQRALNYRLPQRKALLQYEVLVVRNQHDAVASGNAKQGDETDQ